MVFSGLMISLLLCEPAFSLCYQLSGGKLASGSIVAAIPYLLGTYKNDVPNGAIYTVQKAEGFYFKICDQDSLVRSFMDRWVYPEYPNGEWKLILTTKDEEEIHIIKDVGIYKVKKEGLDWKVWKYGKKG